ncbi:MAG: HipA domain-containing protein [Deltaproteobacteria bacterium]|nr:HipA domain-containing protein [Deltaproteobacteria bacterium]
MFRVITVPDLAASLTEQLGTKPKFWFRDEEGQRWLFKEGRPNSGDDWSEKVASELCEFIGLPHVDYELAVWKGRRGVVSRSFVPPGGSLVLGNVLLARVVTAYPEKKFFRVSQHTVRRVFAILRNARINLPIGWSGFPGLQTATDAFVGYLMFDAWIANQDRHHENWGLVTTREALRHLAPSFDHASSLGSNETDENRKDRLTTRDKRRSTEQYVERALSAFYASPSSSKPLSTFAAFQEAGKINPKAADAWADRLKLVSLQDIALVFGQIPPDRITPIAIEFAQRMLELNRQRLLTLQGAWK